MKNNLVLLLLCLLLCTGVIKKVNERIQNKKVQVVVIPLANIVLLVLCCMLMITQSYNPFLYFKF